VALVYQHSHIRIGPDKQPMLANRLRKRLRALGLVSYDDYCAVLRSAQGPDEIEQLVDLIATNHTRFFREPEHFTFLTGRMLPDLLPRLAGEGSPLRVWSAAASSGEEPYSLAIVLADFSASTRLWTGAWRLRIFRTACWRRRNGAFTRSTPGTPCRRSC
jgi:chemotaxis protein methyltransferase CheR